MTFGCSNIDCESSAFDFLEKIFIILILLIFKTSTTQPNKHITQIVSSLSKMRAILFQYSIISYLLTFGRWFVLVFIFFKLHILNHIFYRW
jgi:hypothetical protein